MKDKKTFKKLCSFGDLHLAHLAKAFLMDYEIFVWIKDENIININPFYSAAVGGFKIMVKTEEYDKAKEVINKFDVGPIVPDDFFDEENEDL